MKLISSMILNVAGLLLFNIAIYESKPYQCDRQSLCGCGASNVQLSSRIINGESAVPYSWSMVVSIRYDFLNINKPDTHLCGGTILTESYILSAASCFEIVGNNTDSFFITIAAGIHRRSQNKQFIRQVDRIIYHPNWNVASNKREHDIALLHLAEPLYFSKDRRISRVCLPSTGESFHQTMLNLTNGQSPLIAVGWGRTSIYGEDSDSLRQIKVDLIDYNNTDCINMIGDLSGQFCAGSTNDSSGPCFGDFGGPLFQWNIDRWEQVGISSFTNHNCDKDYPIAYTRVGSYLQWIQNHIPEIIDQINETSTEPTSTVDPSLYEYQCDREHVSCGCGLNNVRFTESRIINAENAIGYSWSMVVSIRANRDSEHLCGGSIIEDSLILTAASCIADTPLYGITVVAGTYRKGESTPFIRQADAVFIHPDYKGIANNFTNDIAILHLSEPFDFKNLFLSRTCLSQKLSFLPDATEYPAVDTLLAIVGWGNTDYENQTIPQVLQQAEVFASDLNDPNCPVQGKNQEFQFCAGTIQNDKVPCFGDVGTPIFQWFGDRWIQVGLVSSINNCSSTRLLGLYTRLVSYHEWILSVIRRFSSSTLTTSTRSPSTDSIKLPNLYECNRNSTCGCGSVPVLITPARIVGGETALEHSWPMIASLRIRYDEDRHICGATIVSNSYVLTAAHCLPGYSTGSVTGLSISTGMTNLFDSNQIRRTVDRIHIHPNYSRTNEYLNDIALLHLNQSLPTRSNNFITKTCIQRVPDELSHMNYIENGTRLTVIGWGSTEFGLFDTPDDLRQVEVYAIDNDHPICQAVINDVQLQFCAGLYEGGRDSCQGDSGGPILKWTGRYWEQVGIISYGDGCAEPGKPGIYTRLSYYYDWISDIIQQDNEFIEPTMTYASTPSTMKSTKPYNHANPFASHIRSLQIMMVMLIIILILINKLRIIP